MYFIRFFSYYGFPFLTGFYSKDLVLELAGVRYVLDSNFVHFLGLTSALFTSIYSIRLILFVFIGKPNFFRIFFSIHESDIYMCFSMFTLCLFSIFIGYIFSDITVGFGSYFWLDSLFFLPQNFSFIEAEFLHPVIKNLPIILSLFGMIFGYVIYLFFLKINISKIYSLYISFLNILNPFFYYAGFFNFVYNKIFNILYQFSYNVSTKNLDKGYFEYFVLLVFINFLDYLVYL